MERAVAMKKLGKILGKSLGYRVDPSAPMEDERIQAREEAKALSAEFEAAAKAELARQKTILEADTEYQRLKAETKRLKKAKDEAWSKTHHYKFTIGVSKNIAGLGFFEVKAQGDSWEDVIGKLSQETSVGA